VAEATGDGEPAGVGDAVGNGGSSLTDETIGVGDATAVVDGAGVESEIGEVTGVGEPLGSAASAVSSDAHQIDANKRRDRVPTPQSLRRGHILEQADLLTLGRAVACEGGLAIRGLRGRPGTMCPL
jgi:hypothetical protein